jgi:hypothetical protein
VEGLKRISNLLAALFVRAIAMTGRTLRRSGIVPPRSEQPSCGTTTRRLLHLRVGLVLCVAAHAPGARAATPQPDLPEFTPVQWLPAAVRELGQATLGIDRIVLGNVPHQPGDTVTLLAQLTEAGRVRQWAVALTEQELKPAQRNLRSPRFTVHLSNGGKVTFDESTYARMSIQVLGPFLSDRSSARSKRISSEALINPEFLGLGLDGTARLWRRLINQARDERPAERQPLSLDISTRPFSSEKIAEHRARLESLQITSEEERSYAGFLPAMMDFFQIARQTRGVRDIIFEVVDLPWWSLITRGGRVTDTHFDIIGPFRKLSPADWGLADAVSVFSMGIVLRLEAEPTLVGRLALTAPRPPLLNCAGILGIAAMRPDGQGPRLMIRVMAGKPAGN